VGTLIQQVAAERHCPVTLELGGKSPQIVFDDADLDAGDTGPSSMPSCRTPGRPARQARVCWWSNSIYEPLLERLGQAFAGLRCRSARPPWTWTWAR
jgi:aldehyde dehydrogenase (NAD+)